MTNAFRAEWARLLRPRSILGLAVPLVAFPALSGVTIRGPRVKSPYSAVLLME